jgi:hypothetical protein
MQKEIERHIITKNSHKIKSYGGFDEITQGLMSHEEVSLL